MKFIASRTITNRESEYWINKSYSTSERDGATQFPSKNAAIREIGRSSQSGERASKLRRGWNLIEVD